DPGQALVGHALSLLIFERLRVPALGQEQALEMLDADDAEELRRDRPAVLLHRREQLGDAPAVDLVGAEELRQRLVRAADLFEHLALHGGPGEPAELADELPHRAVAPEVAVPGDVGREVALQPRLVVPVRARRIARAPFLPMRIGRLDLDDLLAAPG